MADPDVFKGAFTAAADRAFGVIPDIVVGRSGDRLIGIAMAAIGEPLVALALSSNPDDKHISFTPNVRRTPETVGVCYQVTWADGSSTTLERLPGEPFIFAGEPVVEY
jgi:hypothetical protein